MPPKPALSPTPSAFAVMLLVAASFTVVNAPNWVELTLPKRKVPAVVPKLALKVPRPLISKRLVLVPAVGVVCPTWNVELELLPTVRVPVPPVSVTFVAVVAVAPLARRKFPATVRV